MARLHFDAGFDDERTGAHRTLCGRTWQPASTVTLERWGVTCRNCMRQLRTLASAPDPSFVPSGPAPAPPQQIWDHRGEAIVRRSIAGDDGADRAFATVDDALRAWISVAGSSLVGSSSHFGGSPGSRSADRTPATIDRLARALPVERAVVESCAHGIRFDGAADGSGKAALGSQECRTVLVHMQMGRGAARAAERVGITERQARSVWTRIRQAVGEDLYSARVIQYPPNKRTRRKETTMAKPPGYDLDGWKEIAAHLGCGESTAKRWAQRGTDPLPTAEYNGSRVASRARLDAWRVRQVRETAA